VKALLVSGSDAARARTRGALGPAWEIEVAADGIEALRTVATDDEIILVIADETTVPYGAFGLAHELKVLPYPPGVIVLLHRAQDAWLAKWSGADRWLVQPVDAFELGEAANAIARALDESVEAATQAD